MKQTEFFKDVQQEMNNNNMYKNPSEIERNKEVVDIIMMMAETAKAFNKFAKSINDEDIEGELEVIKDALDSSISNMIAIENAIYTADVLNYTQGLAIPTIDQLRAG